MIITVTPIVEGVAVVGRSTTVTVSTGTVGPTGATGATGAAGTNGAAGAQGDPGEGVPTGGTTGQALVKVSGADFDTAWDDVAGGTGAVDSVNGQTGVVVLDADDIADGTTNHAFTAADDTKLAGIATGATANDTDANLKDRGNHTGSQAISTVTGLQTALDGKADDADVTDHTGDTSAAHAASAVAFTPTGAVAATDVQAAIAELDTEKSGTAHTHSGTYEPAGTVATHAAAADPHTGYLKEADYDANSILAATTDNTPVALTVAASRIVGRKASGDIAAMTAAELWALLAAGAGHPEVIGVALSDETTAITTGTAKATIRMPFAMTLTAVRASLTTVSSSGIPTVDINEAGTTILSTKLTIDASEKTSTTAATAAVISDASLADDAEITFDIDVAGTGATGLKVWLIGTRT